MTAFFQKNPPQGVAAKLPEFVKALEAKYPNIKSWGVLGVGPSHPLFPYFGINATIVLLGRQGSFPRHLG